MRMRLHNALSPIGSLISSHSTCGRTADRWVRSFSVRALLGYHPDPSAVRRRLIREARELYRWGMTSERHQPVLSSLKGQLRKFYLYPTFDCSLRCPYCYAEGGDRHTDELDALEFLRITREAVDAGFEDVVIVGGEPLVGMR